MRLSLGKQQHTQTVLILSLGEMSLKIVFTTRSIQTIYLEQYRENGKRKRNHQGVKETIATLHNTEINSVQDLKFDSKAVSS